MLVYYGNYPRCMTGSGAFQREQQHPGIIVLILKMHVIKGRERVRNKAKLMILD